MGNIGIRWAGFDRKLDIFKVVDMEMYSFFARIFDFQIGLTVYSLSFQITSSIIIIAWKKHHVCRDSFIAEYFYYVSNLPRCELVIKEKEKKRKRKKKKKKKYFNILPEYFFIRTSFQLKYSWKVDFSITSMSSDIFNQVFRCRSQNDNR